MSEHRSRFPKTRGGCRRRRDLVLSLALASLAGLACSDVDRTRWAARLGSAESQFELAERYANGRGVEADPDEALAWHEKAAEGGHLPSQLRAAALYEKRGGEAATARALHWLREAAESGDPQAQFDYGQRLGGDEGAAWIERASDAGLPAAHVVHARTLAEGGLQRGEVVALLQKAARQGDPDAAFELAQIAKNKVVSMESEEIAALLQQAADGGHAGAQFLLGARYAAGEGVEKDLAAARSWYRKSADQGFAQAQEALGFVYHAGLGVDENTSEAVKWYRMAAEQGRAPAKSQLGLMYAQGNVPDEETASSIALLRNTAQLSESDVERLQDLAARARINNDRIAVKWYREAIEEGFTPAMINLAKMIDAGRVDGSGPEEALDLYRRAAELGNPVGQSEMAVRLSRGAAVEKDPEAAFRMLEAAAKGGHGPSQYTLASLYARGGRGGEPDFAQAAHWYRAAAESGVEGADTVYASMLAQGKGVPRNEKAALALFEKAAERGDSTAEYSLGIFHEEGRGGLTKSNYEAVKLWKRAAKKGHPQAQAKLGVAMIRGQGTRKNVLEAYGWIAASGVPEAEPWVKELRKQMPPTMLERGEKLAAKRRLLRENPGGSAEDANSDG